MTGTGFNTFVLGNYCLRHVESLNAEYAYQLAIMNLNKLIHLLQRNCLLKQIKMSKI